MTGEIAIEGKGIHARIKDGSYIMNELGFPLRNCYLVHTTEDPAGWAGSRAERIYVFPLGDLPADGSRVDLRDRCYRLGVEPDDTVAKLLERSTLAKQQEAWGGKVKSLLRDTPFAAPTGRNVVAGEEENALLLLSTLGEYDPSLDASTGALGFSFPRTWKRDRARQLDLRGRLRRNSVMLLGFADDPGPVRLFRRAGDDPFRPLEPDPENSWTMYRFRIPATLFEGRHVDEDDDDRQQ